MNIKIEIDIKPEELRRLMGLPDVAGLQEDMISYARTKMSQGMEGFDPATLLRGGSKAWQRLMARAFSRAAEQAEEEEQEKKAGSQRAKSRDKGRANRSGATETKNNKDKSG